MNNFFYFNVALCMLLGLVAVGSMFFKKTSRATMQRVHQVTKTGVQARAKRSSTERVHQLVSPTAIWIRSHFGLSERHGLSERLLRAGYRGRLPIDLYTAARIIVPLIALALAGLIPVARVFWMMALPALTYLAPDLILERAIRKRRTAIRKSMPDTIDLLVICVDAGLGVDQAMMRVAQELVLSSPEMHDELSQINREQRAGKPRLDAWQAMSERIKLPEIDAFVNMLMQTERFGTPIARALSNFATGIRLKRTQLAEENAAKTTIKIIFPLVLFIFPCLFIVLLGPAGIIVLRNFSGNF